MKLRRIALENLGSLYGPQEIDLLGPLADAPLFLVVGPTGAGKSTLLDAVALALFGQTPRLVAAKRDPDSDPRQIMSRGAGSCFAQVELSKRERGASAVYRATWQCRRSRERPDGAFQQPRRVLERLGDDGWRTIVSDTREKIFGPVFEELLEGMTVEDFERSVLLPQGQFAAFLHAEDKERAAILERLTSTSRFRRIGERASALRQAAERRVEDASRDIEGIELPGDDEEAALRRAHVEVSQRLAQRRGELALAQGRLDFLRRAEEIDASLSRAEDALATLAGRAEAHREELASLSEHERCVAAADGLATRDRRRDEARAAREHLPLLSTALADAIEAAARAASLSDAALAQRDATRARAESEAPAITRARELRTRAAAASAELAEARRRWEAAKRDVALTKRELSTSNAELSRRTARRDAAAAARDALLRADASAPGTPLAPLLAEETRRREDHRNATLLAERRRAELANLLGDDPDPAARRQRWRAAEARRMALAKALAEARALLEERDTAATAAAETRARADDRARAEEALAARVHAASLARASCGQRLDALHLQLSDLEFVRSMARERGRLRPHDPCALCGSESHPFVDDARHAEVDERVARQCDELAAAMATVDVEHAELAAIEQAVGRERAAAAAVAGVSAALADDAARALAAKERALSEASYALPIADVDGAELTAALRASREEELWLVSALQELEEAETLAGAADRDERAAGLAATEAAAAVAAAKEGMRQSAEEKVVVAERDLVRARDVAAALTAGLSAREAAASSAADDAARRATEASELHTQSQAALQGLDPDVQEELLLADAARASRAHDEAQRALASAVQARADAATRLAQAQTLAEDRERSLSVATSALAEMLRALGLSGEGDLSRRILDEPTRGRLAALRAELHRANADLTARLHEHRRLAVEHQARRPAGDDQPRPSSEVEATLLELRSLVDQLGVEATTRAVALRQVDEARARVGLRKDELRRLRDELAVWDRLHRLVGRNGGEAFQLYAQTLNLAELIDRANEHLDRFAPRYSLVPAATAGGEARLAFAVGDSFHAGEVRPLTTLSGGETFLVSLALALALASFRRVRMPIETLLLDEGFGGLDRDTLGVALRALEALREEGTQVGIISHVEALKERIGARVLVERMGSGRSRVRVG